ncbi:MAG: OmpA family protein, partial [Elusimicrobia bacterium]|nr:OmpA family protein [Elusimicrobiota bacterium]
FYDSNWELSTFRATSVARLLIDKYEITPQRVGAIGYGQYRPVVPNDTPEGQAKNRRVVFFIKNAPPAGNGPLAARPAAAAPQPQEAAP